MNALAAARTADLDLRRELRVDVAFRTVLVETTMRDDGAIVVNISRFGLLARSAVDVAIGSFISVRLPVVGAVRAEVVWSLGGRIGCQFVEPISHEIYAELLRVIPRD